MQKEARNEDPSHGDCFRSVRHERRLRRLESTGTRPEERRERAGATRHTTIRQGDSLRRDRSRTARPSRGRRHGRGETMGRRSGKRIGVVANVSSYPREDLGRQSCHRRSCTKEGRRLPRAPGRRRRLCDPGSGFGRSGGREKGRRVSGIDDASIRLPGTKSLSGARARHVHAHPDPIAVWLAHHSEGCPRRRLDTCKLQACIVDECGPTNRARPSRSPETRRTGGRRRGGTASVHERGRGQARRPSKSAALPRLRRPELARPRRKSEDDVEGPNRARDVHGRSGRSRRGTPVLRDSPLVRTAYGRADPTDDREGTCKGIARTCRRYDRLGRHADPHCTSARTLSCRRQRRRHASG